MINRSLTDSSLNFLYIGEDNVIELKGAKNVADYNVVVKKAGSRIFHDRDNLYFIWVERPDDTCILEVFNKGGKKILERTYSVKTILPLRVVIAGKRDTTAIIGRLLANPFLSIVSPGCFFRLQYRVIKFTAIFIHDTDSIYTYTVDHLLSPEQIGIIKTLKPGDKIYFDDIYGLGPNSRTQHFSSFWIKIE